MTDVDLDAPIESKLRTAADQLRRIPYAYADLQRLAVTYPQPGPGRAAGKPSSGPPRGADTTTRRTQIVVARHLADANRAIDEAWGSGVPVRPWVPPTRTVRTRDGRRDAPLLGTVHVETVVECQHGRRWHDNGPACVDCHADEARMSFRLVDVWAPAPDDLSLQPLTSDQIVAACRQLRALVEWGQTRDLSGYAARVFVRVCSLVDQSRRRLVAAGVWERAVQPLAEYQPKCVHCGDNPPEAGREWCDRCRRAHAPSRASCTVCGYGRRAA